MKDLKENKEYIVRLRQAVEEMACRKMLTPKDFDYLSELIRERQGDRVSASTLKRIWGYVHSPGMPRRNTLDVLAQFVGSKDWDAFCSGDAASVEEPSSDERVPGASDAVKPFRRKTLYTFILLAVLTAVALALTPLFKPQRQSTSAIVFQSGQLFSTPDEYLSLFGIFDCGDRPWSQPLPHHQGIIVWGPEYQHPDWHNEGCADSLMPTITEYWQPADTAGLSPAVIAMRNADNYLRATSFGELRITFMKGLSSDSSYIFLGIYRLDTAASDSTRLVWRRVAMECDLFNLDDLEQLRR